MLNDEPNRDAEDTERLAHARRLADPPQCPHCGSACEWHAGEPVYRNLPAIGPSWYCHDCDLDVDPDA